MIIRKTHRLSVITFGLLLMFCVLIHMGERNAFGKSPDDFTINLLGVYANAEPELILNQDFEAGWHGWYSDNGVWEVGTPTSGPDSCRGSQCAGTILSGNYAYTTDSRLVSPSVQLPKVKEDEEILLRFWQWFSYALDDTGSVQIQIHDEMEWQPWTMLETKANEFSGGWSFACVDLTAYAGQRVRIGFYHDDDIERNSFGQNIHAESSGWYIDEVEIVPHPGCTLTVSAIGRGSITDPNLGVNSYPCGQEVAVTAVADPNFEFVRWEGTAIDANKTEIEYQDPFGSKIWVTVDGVYTLRAIFEEVVYDFPLDSNPGWAMKGQWEFGIPTGNGCENGNPDPTSGHTGQNVIGVNLNGCYDVSMGGPYSVVAGPFDMRNYEDVNLRFWEWLNTDWSAYVKNSLEISLDGGTWELVWQNPERMDITDNSWNLVEYDISSLADGQPSVYLRWTYQVLRERAYPYTGWNIDDIQLIGRR